MLAWKFNSPYDYGYVEPDASGNNHDALFVWPKPKNNCPGGQYTGIGEAPDGGNAAEIAEGSRGAILSRDLFTLPSEFTVMCWFKPIQGTVRYDNMLKFQDQAGSDKLTLSCSNGVFRVGSFLTNSKTWDFKPHPLSGWENNQWVHLAFTYNDSGVTFYINGVVHTSPDSGSPWETETQVKLLLGNYVGGNAAFYGPMDECRIYPKVLNARAINKIQII
jgi:hypothetical protein